MPETTSINPAIPDFLVDYLTERWNREARRIDSVYAAMNPRERKLFREAAVLGFVEGVKSRPYSLDATIPPDPEIVSAVIGTGLANGDLHPTIARMERLARRRAQTIPTEGEDDA